MDCLRAEKMERNETCDPTETPGPELPCFTMLEQILRSTMDVSRTAEVGHIICGLYGKLHQFQKNSCKEIIENFGIPCMWMRKS